MNHQQAVAAAGIAIFIGLLLIIAIYVITAIGLFKAFKKAGRPGWPAFVPVYNVIVMLQLARQSPYLAFILLGGFIPFIGSFVSLGFSIFLSIVFGKAYNKSTGFIVGLILLPIVFYPILGFGDSKYAYTDEADANCAA